MTGPVHTDRAQRDTTDRRLVMGLQFYPRGGSAFVARYLLDTFAERGWAPTLVTGSLGAAGAMTHADTFFGDVDIVAADYTAAQRAFETGEDLHAAAPPIHWSYEDAGDVADRILASIPPRPAHRYVDPWIELFSRAIDDRTEFVHLHHLTAQFDAVTQQWLDLPVLVHLHGTDLKFIEAVDARRTIAERLGETLETMPAAIAADRTDSTRLDDAQHQVLAATHWSKWRYGEHWRRHLVDRARRADHLVTVSEPDRRTALRLFDLPSSRVTAIVNGVDTHRFHSARPDPARRRALLRKWLVDEPRGWDTSGVPGTVRYQDADLDRLLGPDDDHLVFVNVGRFTEAKRLPVLIRAFARARSRSSQPISLLVWGGHPGEVEGEHPVDVAREVGDDGIFFVGWRGHDELPDGLSTADVLVMASVNDSFPMTALEAMSTGLPVLATVSGGFPDMIDVDSTAPTGWLVPPDDIGSLADAMVDIAADPEGLAQRGRNAREHAAANLAWTARAPRFETIYEQLRTTAAADRPQRTG